MTDFLSWLGPCSLIGLSWGVAILGIFAQLRSYVRDRLSRYNPALPPCILPVLMLVFLLLAPFLSGAFLLRLVRLLAAAVLFSALLLTLTPLLRKRISAEGCAALWVLPNLLVLRLLFFKLPNDPLFRIRLSRPALRSLSGIWAAGFLAVLGWKLLSHLRFRKAVLRESVPASEAERELFLRVWAHLNSSANEINPKHFQKQEKKGKKLRILRSAGVKSPLTVGLFYQTSCLVLPDRPYSEAELALIFRHEGIHLLHRDNSTKFTVTVLCAAGWFIPTLWLGLRKAAEDLELSCDDLAVEGMDEDRRKEYAGLLLTNAGSAKGFTTCLSATASGLRYRMARVLHPQKRRAGYLAVILLSAVFLLCFSLMDFKIPGGTIQTELLDRDGGWEVMEVRPNYKEHKFQEEYCDDPAVCARVEAAIANLELAAPADRLNYGIYPYLWVKLRHGDDVIIVSLGNWALSAHNCTTDQVQFYEYCELHTEEIQQIRDLIPYIPED